jgi:hypothetical protein
MKPLLVLLLIAACGCPQKKTDNSATQPAPPPSGATTTTPPPTTQGPGSDTGANPGSANPGSANPGSANPGSANPGSANPTSGSAAEPTPNWPKNAPGIGENCGPNDACAKGLTCVSYYGIAGARGPQFKSCEIKCTADKDCPAGHKCTTIADGPGQVCRK